MSVVTGIRTSEELVVPFTPAEVWAVLTDAAAYPRWWPTMWPARVLLDCPGVLGTEIEVRPWVGRGFRYRFVELREPFAIRLRFFGGALEGPGGFSIEPHEGGTRVRHDIDVLARGFATAMLSYVVPFDRVHRFRMRSILKSLARRLQRQGKAAERAAETAAPVGADEAAHLAAQGVEPLVAEDNFEIARRYLDALSSKASPEDLARFLATPAVHEEFPHRFLERGNSSDREGMLRARARDLDLFAPQLFTLDGATGGGSQVAMEVGWSGVVAASRAPFIEGQELDARLAVFLTFEDGKIVRQRTYSCFEPWSSEAERSLLVSDRASALNSAAVQPSITSTADPRQGAESNFDIARRYLAALSAGADAREIARFFAEDAIQEEFPNRYEPRGVVRALEDIRQARSLSLALLSTECYDLRGATGGGSQVAMEVRWTAVVGGASGPFAAGQALEVDIAVFLKFRDGLIVRQRNYACVPAAEEEASRG